MALKLNFENELKGKTLVSISIETFDYEDNANELVLKTCDGETYRLNHYQVGSECVFIEDICGDLSDLIGQPLVEAEEIDNRNHELYTNAEFVAIRDDGRWTFYKLGTAKGSVTIRWCGVSNGNYSEQVDFTKDE